MPDNSLKQSKAAIIIEGVLAILLVVLAVILIPRWLNSHIIILSP